MRMQMVTRSKASLRFAGLGLLLSVAGLAPYRTAAQAQTPAPVPAAATTPPQLGTVKAVSGNTITLATDAGPTVTITVPDGTKVSQLAVGSTDMKTATPSQMSAIAVGDRVLASVRAGDTPTSFTARQVVLIKSADIAQMQAAEQEDWKKNGVGGIVTAVDAGSGTITLTSGTKKIVVTTSAKTDFRRFTGDSVKYQDAKPGTLAQIQAGDQVQARGVKAADGLSVQAAEVVSGSFKNLSGVVSTIDQAAGKITLKDLATKKVYAVTVSANTDIRKMPLQMATNFAARTNGSQSGAATGGGGGRGGNAAGGADAAGAARRSASSDLSQMIARMPTSTLADLKNGDAVMIVASEPSSGSTTVTAITLLSGVEPILTANPNGGMSLSMSLGGGGGGGEE
jgi:uncharacterized protein DUF5666